MSTIDEVFFALSDPTRRSIVERLSLGEAPVGAATAELGLGKPAISRHVKVLEGAGLVHRRVVGREHWLSIVPDGFSTVAEWLAHHHQFWTSSLDRLGALVAELERGTSADPDEEPTP